MKEDGDAFTFVAGKERMDHLVPPSWVTASQGTLIETSPAAVALMAEIAVAGTMVEIRSARMQDAGAASGFAFALSRLLDGRNGTPRRGIPSISRREGLTPCTKAVI